MSLKFPPRVLLGLLLLGVLPIRAQCPLISHRDLSIDRYLDFNSMVHYGYCQGPSCPNGQSPYMVIARGNPFGSYCPDESAWVAMERGIFSGPPAGIYIFNWIEGERSGAVFSAGDARIDCNGVESIYDVSYSFCIECRTTQYDSCQDYPGEGSQYAWCEVSTGCTSSCQRSSLAVGMYSWDTCEYRFGESHYCVAEAYTDLEGAYASSATFFQGSPYTSGYQHSLCNGYYAEDYETRPCPQF